MQSLLGSPRSSRQTPEPSLRRRLDAEIVRRGLAQGRDEAKRLIAAGSVLVDGSSLIKPATMVTPASSISVSAAEPQWASRAGAKLAHALEAFALDPSGARAIDVGASTGGFTDVLLAAGASSITAVDVGYGQMVWRLRNDDRVVVRDRTNFRTVDVTTLGGPFDLAVVDVSFISVGLLAANLAGVGRHATDYVVLVKPQFEAGRDGVGRGGIVADGEIHAEVITRLAGSLEAAGIGSVGLDVSPIRGAKGNREFLLHGRLGAPGVIGQEQILDVVGR